MNKTFFARGRDDDDDGVVVVVVVMVVMVVFTVLSHFFCLYYFFHGQADIVVPVSVWFNAVAAVLFSLLSV